MLTNSVTYRAGVLANRVTYRAGVLANRVTYRAGVSANRVTYRAGRYGPEIMSLYLKAESQYMIYIQNPEEKHCFLDILRKPGNIEIFKLIKNI